MGEIQDTHKLGEIQDTHELGEIQDTHELGEIQDTHGLILCMSQYSPRNLWVSQITPKFIPPKLPSQITRNLWVSQITPSQITRNLWVSQITGVKPGMTTEVPVAIPTEITPFLR